jgi:hypothetical protein
MLPGPHRNWVQVRVEKLLLRGRFWAAEDGGAGGGGRLCVVYLWGGVGREMGA